MPFPVHLTSKIIYEKIMSSTYFKSLKLGRIPTAWKISNIVPIPKSGPLKEVTNYRPISLLGIVSKVLERCIKRGFGGEVVRPLAFHL